MSLSVNSVSRVSFGNNIPSTQEQSSVDDRLNRPGAYTKPADDNAKPADNAPKKHTALKVAAGIVIAAAVIAGALYGVTKHFPDTFNPANKFGDFKDAEFMEKVKGYVTTGIAKAGEAIGNAGEKVVKFFKGIFSGKDTPAATDAK